MTSPTHTALTGAEKALAERFNSLPDLEPSPSLDIKILSYARTALQKDAAPFDNEIEASINFHRSTVDILSYEDEIAEPSPAAKIAAAPPSVPAAEISASHVTGAIAHAPVSPRIKPWLFRLSTAAAAVLAAGLAWQFSLPSDRSESKPHATESLIESAANHEPPISLSAPMAEIISTPTPAADHVGSPPKKQRTVARTASSSAPAPVTSELNTTPPEPLPESALIQRAAVTLLPAWQEDGHLTVEAWLERIQQRLAQNDRVSAHASLKLLLERHPHTDLPEELEALLFQ